MTLVIAFDEKSRLWVLQDRHLDVRAPAHRRGRAPSCLLGPVAHGRAGRGRDPAEHRMVGRVQRPRRRPRRAGRRRRHPLLDALTAGPLRRRDPRARMGAHRPRDRRRHTPDRLPRPPLSTEDRSALPRPRRRTGALGRTRQRRRARRGIVEWSEDDLAFAHEQIALYKEIRETVQHGALHRLQPPSASGLSAVQYVSPARTVVFAYRQSGHSNLPERRVRLRGLDPATRYRDEDSGAVHHGAVLLSQGITLDLPKGDHGSALVRLCRI